MLGEFAGNVMPGALALVGDKAVYLFEPAVHKDVTLVEASGVNDIAALAPGAPGRARRHAPRQDRRALLGEPRTSSSRDPGEIETSSIATGNFADLDLVRSGNINGAGRDDVVGANGANVHVLLHSGSGWAAGSSFQAPGTVRDMGVIDWDDTATATSRSC